MPTSYATVLTIAGSDSGGGAGIQADIKSISANGGYAATVITASTAQNTQGVTDIHPIPLAHIIKQLEAVLDDISFGAVKIGMLHSAEVIEAVQHTLMRYNIKNIILDPVMLASSGSRLLNDDAIESLRHFLPYTYLVTPNVPEAEVLIGHSITLENVAQTVKALGEKYQTSVLLKGGHFPISQMMTDTLYNHENKNISTITNRAIKSKNTHGTGCSLSSAIATYIAKGETLENAVIQGCDYLNKAIKNGKDKILGKGDGPLNHFGI